MCYLQNSQRKINGRIAQSQNADYRIFGSDSLHCAVSHFNPAAPVHMNCQADTITKKRLASGDDLELKVTGSLFIYDEHHAMIVQRGDITVRGKTYSLDRKINFDIKRLDHGFYMTTHREISKTPDDNAPDELTRKSP
ncbi:hypothetical protein M5585_20940 [Serratia ureilytica]